MICFGKDAIDYPLQGMLPEHMSAFAAVAKKRQEIIMVRPVSVWAKTLIKAGFPTKGFHVKAKSSNWGPQCGLIVSDPDLAWLSKTGKGDKQKANKEFITKALEEKQPTVPLELSRDRIQELKTKPDPSTGQPPVIGVKPAKENLILTGICPHSRKEKVEFWAFYTGTTRGKKIYKIHVILKEDTIGGGKELKGLGVIHPIWVFSGPTEDGSQKPLVADYDLLGVCPRWADWSAEKDIPIIPVAIKGKAAQKGVEYFKELQRRRDQRRLAQRKPLDALPAHLSGKKKKAGSEVQRYEEHLDYGNWSKRVRDSVLDLNKQMGYTGRRECLKTVHHSADLISPFVQEGEDYVPATIFLPDDSLATDLFKKEGGYESGIKLGRWALASTTLLVDTKEDLEDFFLYLTEKGYYVPLNAGHEELRGIKGMVQKWGPKGFSKEFRAKLERIYTGKQAIYLARSALRLDD